MSLRHRYYSTDYRDEVITALNSIKENTSPNLSSGISGVETNGHAVVEDCKTECLSAAQNAETHVGSLDDRIDLVIQGLINFHSEVQSTGEEISRLCENVEETMEACITALDALKDLLSNASFADTECITKSDIDSCFGSLDIAEENNSEYIYEYYTDDNGFVIESSVQETFDNIEAGTTVVVDEDGNETYILTPEAEAYANMYAQFEFEYLSSDEITDEKTEWLYNVNLRCGTTQSDLPSTNMYPYDAGYEDGNVLICETYDTRNSYRVLNERLYDLNLEYYNTGLFGQDTARDDKFVYVSCFIDATDVIARYDHISVPCVTPYSVYAACDLDSDVGIQLELTMPTVSYTYDSENRTASVSFPNTRMLDGVPNEQVYMFNCEPYDDPTGYTPILYTDRVDFESFDISFESSARQIFDLDYDDYSKSHLAVILEAFGYTGEIPDTLDEIVGILETVVDFPYKTGLDLMWFFFDEAASDSFSRQFDEYKFYMYLDTAFNFHGSVVTFNSNNDYTGSCQQAGYSFYYYNGDLELFNNYTEYLSEEIGEYSTYQDITPDDIQSMDDIADARTLSYQDYKNLYDSYWTTYCETHDYSGDPSARLAPPEIIDQLTALIGQGYSQEEVYDIIAALP